MHIIFDQDSVEDLKQKHILLELDTLEINGQTRTLYCLLENFSYNDVPDIFHFAELHQQFIDLYKQGQYQESLVLLKKCQSYEYNDIKSFYHVMEKRLTVLIDRQMSDDQKLVVIDHQE